MTKRPWFPFYAADFLTDEDVTLMSYEEIGIYSVLLAKAWLEGSIPADLPKLAGLLKLSPTRLERLWPKIAPCWTETTPGRLTNPRQEKERARADHVSEKRAEAGKKGAIATHGDGQPDGNCHDTAEDPSGAIATVLIGPGHTQSHPQSQSQRESAPRKRGSRLPPDFALTEPRRAYAASKGLPPAAIDREFEKFTNHYRSKSGQRGVALDWDASWRTWVLRVEVPRGGWPAPLPESEPEGDYVTILDRGKVPLAQAKREGLIR